jgi:ATP-dependent exoDNAse (exonuclease V) alpha subunit
LPIASLTPIHLPRISSIIKSHFPYEPTLGQLEFFSKLDMLMPESVGEVDTLVLRGYAGTGKTTVISAVVNVLPLFNLKSMLLAPTGRAAKVLSSYAGKNAFTIHKIIYRQVADPSTGGVRFIRQKNYANKTIFIVDESSLISNEKGFLASGLLDDLVEFVFQDGSNRLILVGDNAQLPPVGSVVSPALDVLYLQDKYGMNLVQVELSEVLRQEEKSGILINATHLRDVIFKKDQSLQFDTRTYKDIFRMTNERFEDGIRYAYQKVGMENTAILCRSNWQAVRYNEYVRRMILFKEDEIEAGDVLMVVKNNYSILEPDSAAGFIANGEFAEVRKIFNLEDKYGFRFADLELQLVDYPDLKPFRARVTLDTLHSNSPSFTSEDNNRLYQQVLEDYKANFAKKELKKKMQADEYLNALQVKFAYALTCHKSQGGQWQIVFVDPGNRQEEKPDEELTRWMYTALTRAQKEVFLINFNDCYFNTKSNETTDL